MANKNIKEVEGGAKTMFNTSDALELDDGTTSTYILLTDVAKMGEGVLYNGKISPTVASDNLTLAIKTTAGADPSTSSPVGVKINGTIRWITSALSVTVNAGANSFASGAAAFATFEIDYFAYVGWRAASSAVVLGMSRIPFARLYSDFSSTATNERYGVFSTTPAAGDDVVVCGRFAATLSAGAGYTWTVPTYTNANLVQTPIFSTRRLDFSPTWSNLSVGDGTQKAYYQLSDVLDVHIEIVFGSTSSISGDPTHLVPFAASYSYGAGAAGGVGLARFRDASPTTVYTGVVQTANTNLVIRAQNITTTYLVVTALSSTVPFTWTTSDVLNLDYRYGLR